VPGFLFNKGKGRTEFRRVLSKVDDSIYVIGIDTLKLSAAWLQGGNRFGTTGKFGTLDNNHIDFYTNNTQFMRLTKSGSLLIGTTTDDGNSLQVKGRISITDAQTSDIKSPRFQVLVGDESVEGGTGFLFYGDAVSNGPIRIANGHLNHFRKFYFQTTGQPGDTNATYNFTYNSNTDDAFNIYNYAEGKSKLFLTASGNLLLGDFSTDNGAKLQVNGSSYFSGSARFAGLANDNSLTRILVSDATGNLYYRDASSLALNGAINSDLAINGTVSAQKMLISQTGRWPDYVFSKQYQLPSLIEVENYIKQNSHLPGIPAAGEVEKKGIDVANNQAALLKKIEELTLYAIDQEKKLQKQSDEITELKIQNKELLILKQEMDELKALIKTNNQQ
jgi:hypothetical protein